MSDHLTIEEFQAYIDAIIGEDFSAPKLLPIRIAEQLLAAMQQEADLMHDIERHLAICTELGTENQKLRIELEEAATELEDAYCAHANGLGAKGRARKIRKALQSND